MKSLNRWQHALHYLLLTHYVAFGVQGIDWQTSLVDPIEWTQPRYYHQN